MGHLRLDTGRNKRHLGPSLQEDYSLVQRLNLDLQRYTNSLRVKSFWAEVEIQEGFMEQVTSAEVQNKSSLDRARRPCLDEGFA